MSCIIPNDATLYARIASVCYKNKISVFGVQHHIIDRFIINTCHGIRECIEFDKDDIIIDGFINHSPTNDFHYHGKTVYELLGGNKKCKTANPIDIEYYIVSPWFIESHPFKHQLYPKFPTIKETIRSLFHVKS